MKSDEFLKYTSPDNDVSSVQYVLDARKTDQIEYLVRRNGAQYDQWVKSSDLTCPNKILDFYDGKVPSNIVKNLRPEDESSEQLKDQIPDDDKFIIYGAEVENNEIMLKVHLPKTKGIVLKRSNELIPEYMNEIVEYYEKYHLGE